MLAIRGHFDGKVIIPSGPVDLPRDREMLFHVEELGTSTAPLGVPGSVLLQFSGLIAKEDLDLMSNAIAEGCEQVQADEW